MKPFSCIRNQIEPKLTEGRVFFNKPKLLKEFLKSWPHSEMQWASSTAMRVIPGGHKTTVQQAPDFLRSHQQCFSFGSWNAFCCTNLESSFIKSAQELLQSPSHPNPSSNIPHMDQNLKLVPTVPFPTHCFSIIVTNKNYRCHLLYSVDCNIKPDCLRHTLTHDFFHQWQDLVWWMGINGVTTPTKKWVKNLQLTKRLKHNYQFKLLGNSPAALSPTYRQFGQAPEVNLSSLNKTLESCIGLCIRPWKTIKKYTDTEEKTPDN